MIYFFQAKRGGPIKIGHAANPEERLNQCQIGNPEPLVIRHVMEGGFEMERRAHKEWAEHHLRGEWFRPASPILNFIKQNSKYVVKRRTRRGGPIKLSDVLDIFWLCHNTPLKKAAIARRFNVSSAAVGNISKARTYTFILNREFLGSGQWRYSAGYPADWSPPRI